MQHPPSSYRSRLLVTGLSVAAVLVLLSAGRVTSHFSGADETSGGIERLIRRLPYPDEDAVSIQTSREGSVWVATRHGITRFAGGHPERPSVLLDPERYRERFRRRMQPLSVVRVSDTGEVWAGTWTGQVLRHVDGAWLEVSDRHAGPVDPIRAIAFDGSDVYFASRGLWRWSPAGRRLEPVPGIARANVTGVALTRDGTLLASLDDRLLLRRGGAWRTLWRTGADGGAITVLLVTRGGDIAIGTRDGIRTLGTSGRVHGRSLSGHWIHAIAQGPDGTLWAGTRGRGFFVLRPEGWRRVRSATDVATHRVRALAVDAEDRLWLGLHGSGLHVSQPDALAAVAARR